jgi:hypothetical protein
MKYPLISTQRSSLFAIGLIAMIAIVAERNQPTLQIVTAPAATQPVATTDTYSIHGVFVDGSSCEAPCPYELTGLPHNCQTIGAMLISSGAYQNRDLSGARIAYAAVPGQWIKIYVDGRDREQKDSAAAFARDVLKNYGPVRGVADAKIELMGKGGDFMVTVDEGRTMALTTEPVIGGDGRNPIAYGNTKNPLNPVFYQGRTVRGQYADGDVAFTLKGTNACFNENMMGSGRI